MTSEQESIHTSKFLSLVLRHKPETIGLVLDYNGWADVTELIEKMNQHGTLLSLTVLDHIVTTSNKKRFAFNEDKTKIRASQGHSVEVELNLEEVAPPEYLYHGTGENSVTSILQTGLEKRNRQHVHLSDNIDTAIIVGTSWQTQSA